MPAPPDPDTADLRRRLDEAEETLRAIRAGEIDALVVAGADGERVFTLQGADHPYRVLIEGMGQGAVTLSADGTVMYANACFSRMVGHPQEKIVGTAVSDLLPPAARPAFAALFATARDHPTRGELSLGPCADLPVYVSLAPLPAADGAAVGVVVTDLTEQRKNQDLREADRRKDEFLAMLAHELRNPLAPVRNALFLLKQPNLSPAAAAQARDMADRQIGHMARLLDDLLDVSRISRGRIDLRVEPLDLAAVIHRTVEAIRLTAESRRHHLSVSLPAGPLPVSGDPTRLEQVLTNLLNNACKYTDPGGHITLSAGRDGADVVVRVRDDGIGLLPDMVGRVFDLFVQAERRTDRSQGGIGIGLTLVRRLVELHGGTVAAASDGPGRGSEFTVRLPGRNAECGVRNAELNPGAESDAAASDSAIRIPHSAFPDDSAIRNPQSAILPQRVLVVDDNVDAADSLALMLGLTGRDVRTAADGPAALAEAAGFRPAVVVLDIGLPGMDGYEVARRLREAPGAAGVRLIALTGWGQDEDRRRSRDAGFDHHLTKPVEPGVLLGLLE